MKYNIWIEHFKGSCYFPFLHMFLLSSTRTNEIFSLQVEQVDQNYWFCLLSFIVWVLTILIEHSFSINRIKRMRLRGKWTITSFERAWMRSRLPLITSVTLLRRLLRCESPAAYSIDFWKCIYLLFLGFEFSVTSTCGFYMLKIHMFTNVLNEIIISQIRMFIFVDLLFLFRPWN